MANIAIEFLPGDDVWIVDADLRVMAGTVHSVSANVFELVPVSPIGGGNPGSPFETTTTTTTTAVPTTTVAPTTTAPPSSSPPIVTTTSAPSTSAPPTSSPPTPTTTPPPSTLPPEPILTSEYTIVVSYLVNVVISGVVRIATVAESKVFSTVEEATEYVTQSLLPPTP